MKTHVEVVNWPGEAPKAWKQASGREPYINPPERHSHAHYVPYNEIQGPMFTTE